MPANDLRSLLLMADHSFTLEGGEHSIRLSFLRPASEALLGSKLRLSLLRSGPDFRGLSSGEVNCETLRESRRLPWMQETARISLLALDRIEVSYFAPVPLDAEGACELKYRQENLTLVPASDLDATAPSGEAERLEAVRARRVAWQKQRERVRENCREVRAEIGRSCVQITQWNAVSCKTFDEAAATCSRAGL